MTANAIERLTRSLRTCPDHGMPDCSPLLNGCSLVNQNHEALARVDTLLQAAEEWAFQRRRLIDGEVTRTDLLRDSEAALVAAVRAVETGQ